MTPSRISSARLHSLSKELLPRYTAPLPHLAHARLLSGAQLDRLLGEPGLSPETVGRVRRRIMARLVALGLVTMLNRRVGGIRAGSVGHVYALTTAGHRLLAILSGQPEPARHQPVRAPGELFLHHTLAVSGVYVDLIENSRGGVFSVHTFTTEPDCWHPAGNGARLRPDAYTVLRHGTTGHCWWLEIDNGTENVPRLRAKIRTYRDHANSGGVGPDGVPPRLLFTTPDHHRAAQITALTNGTDTADMITAVPHHDAAAYMIRELHHTIDS
jgi:hypothetical protein